MVKIKLEDDDEGANKRSRPSSAIIGITRAISACQRCRAKKVRCDQNFPKCYKCEKAGVECIGIDPATGREVPRAYIIHLEDRISLLESKLKEKGVDPNQIDGNFDLNQYRSDKQNSGDQESLDTCAGSSKASSDHSQSNSVPQGVNKLDVTALESPAAEQKHQSDLLDEVKFNTINHKDNRFVSTTQAISFAKLMSTAMKFREKNTKSANTPEVDPTTNGDKDDFIQPALLPPKNTAQEFLKIHFSQANSQLPILHREEFIRDCFLPIYGKLDPKISLASNYTAINTSLFSHAPYYNEPSLTWFYQYKKEYNEKLQKLKLTKAHIDPIKISKEIVPPKKFHKALFFLNILFAISSSTHHLQYPSTVPDSFRLSALKYIDHVYSSTDQLQTLQAILLMALYSIMRPALPGCWYVVGSALRLCIDLGLQNESITQKNPYDSFTKDKRRRLFWCTYSIDRQICFYLNRPVGIPDEAISTPFPTQLDDALIVPDDNTNFDYLNNHSKMSTYKSVSIAMFRVRKIQAEVQRMLYQNYELPRCYKTLAEWKLAKQQELKSWKNMAPKTKRKMNCDFYLDFFSLNYNHTILILHGLSPKNLKLSKDDFFQVSEASKELINIYSQLLVNKNINYTWAAILNLFMAGTSYLYTIYNSEELRRYNSLYEVKKITQECITVLNSLKDRSDTALSCRDTFEMLTAAVVKLRYNETVHGNIKLPSAAQISKMQPAGHINSNLKNLVETLESQQFTVKQEQGAESYQNYSLKLENELNPFQTLDEDFMPQPQVQLNFVGEHRHSDSSKFSSENSDRPILSAYLINQAGHEILEIQSPTTFEWVSTNNEHNQQDTYGHQDELQHFFSELEKSPLSSNSRKNSFSDSDFAIGQKQNAQPSAFLQGNGTPFSHHSNDTVQSAAVIVDNVIMAHNKYQQDREPHFNNGQNPSSARIVANASSETVTSEPTVVKKEGRKVFEMLHTIPVESLWDQFFTPSTNGNYSGLSLDN